MRIVAFAYLILLPFTSALWAQQPNGAPLPAPVPPQEAARPSTRQRVDLANSYHRVLALVPMVGTGTHDDPKRPMFVPAPSAQVAGDRSGIIAWQHQVSDDGSLALVELVAADRNAFAQLFASSDPRVKVFETGKHTQAEIEAAFRQVKAAFSFTNFRPLSVQ